MAMREFEVRIVTVHGDIAPDVYAYARRKVGQLAKLAPGPVLLARVRFDQAPDPAAERPARVQATLDVNGRLVRGAVAARDFDEAIDLLQSRLRQRLEHLTGRLRDRRRRRARSACRSQRELLSARCGSESGDASTATRADRGPHVNWAERP
jgi:ribosome-associated translation inhibitor RaiA